MRSKPMITGQRKRPLHGAYAAKHHEGEWFNLDQRDVDNICEILEYKDGMFVR
jgi:hypothetical protein